MDANVDVVKLIGSGAFSKVYLCRMTREMEGLPKTSFIVKEININGLVRRYMSKSSRRIVTSKVKPGFTPYQESSLHMPESEYYYERLTQLIRSEIEILQMTDHANIVEYFRHTEEDDRYCLHLEYCDLGDVHGLLKSGTSDRFLRNVFSGMERKFVFHFIRDVSYGIQFLHSMNIIHRDIKLQNILVKSKPNGAYEFKISDLGFACYDMSSDSSERETILSKKYYRICGTPYYMAPELVMNMDLLENVTSYNRGNDATDLDEFYDKSIDIWSFGVCIYELIYNSVIFPYDIEDMSQLKIFFEKIDQVYIDSTIRRSSNLDDVLGEVLCRMLRIDAKSRIGADDLCVFADKLLIKKSRKELKSMDTQAYDPRSYYDVRIKISTSVKPDDVADTDVSETGLINWVMSRLKWL
jgi:serine/threonine protein kinase